MRRLPAALAPATCRARVFVCASCEGFVRRLPAALALATCRASRASFEGSARRLLAAKNKKVLCFLKVSHSGASPTCASTFYKTRVSVKRGVSRACVPVATLIRRRNKHECVGPITC